MLLLQNRVCEEVITASKTKEMQLQMLRKTSQVITTVKTEAVFFLLNNLR